MMKRRDFLRAGLAGGTLALGPWASMLVRANQGRAVSLVADPADSVAASAPAQWALDELARVLRDAGVRVDRADRLDKTASASPAIVASGAAAAGTAAMLAAAGVEVPKSAESLAIVPVTVEGRRVLVAAGADPRGLVYALLELADRARLVAPIDDALQIASPIVERPANPVRSVMRQFTSETLDAPWLFDDEMWPAYLTLLASQRFNRLHLGFGLGYDTLRRVRDSYLLFIYPFFVDVPGYDVRVTNLTSAERDRNLEMLRRISAETVARGLEFQLGIWTHGYELIDSPDAKYVVEGLTPANHAAYCRDALAQLLRACPDVSAVALRIHGESGIAEGSYDFWRTVFDGVPRSGRTVEIDLHAKGIDATMIDNALATGMPVAISPKYWAEHLGMPYHQAAIRDLEMPVPGRVGAGLMTLSEGSRVFTRYGYADLLRDDRRYTVRHRVFSGTQRLLLSGDPDATRSYSRMFQFCGSTGADLMEPLTCRGRRGTGADGGRRSGYVDASLEPRWDWQKFDYWYRVWGRLMFDPDADPDVWRRHFGGDAPVAALESALANASRVLPIVTTAHLPSAACDAYWPEVYWNQALAEVPRGNPYGDSPSPKDFQHVSPLDPQLFSTMTEHASDLLAGRTSAKYSPVEVAVWLEQFASAADRDLARAGAAATVDHRRLAIDVAIQADLGRFFAAKFRAGVLYAIFEQSNDRGAIEQALAAYRTARQAWAAASERAAGVYADDLSASDKISNRGCWADRLPAIDRDIDALAGKVASAAPSSDARVRAAVASVLASPRRGPAPCTHQAPSEFRPGQDLPIAIDGTGDSAVASARLWYRHVNQAERYEQVEMRGDGRRFTASIPGAYTDSPYPLQYYVDVRDADGHAWIVPGFDDTLANLPYVVVERA